MLHPSASKICLLFFLVIANPILAKKSAVKSDETFEDDYEETAVKDDNTKKDDIDRDGGGGHGGGYGGGYGGGSDKLDLLAPLVLLAPLAGLAALYAAAAINSNSALITIAVMNTGRQMRSVDFSPQFNFVASRNVNVTEVGYKMMSRQLECSGVMEDKACLRLLGCQVSVLQGMEKRSRESMGVLLEELMKNPFIGEEEKGAVMEGVEVGRRKGKCQEFVCRSAF